MISASRNVKFDWLTILLFAALVIVGWINIYSASLSDIGGVFVDFDQIYFKQIIWIGLSIILIIFILALDSKFYERFASIIYLISLVSLLLLFPFGKEISGATSWYSFGGISIQPSEFAKAATALALAKYLSDIQTSMNRFKHQLKAFAIIALPVLLIIPQPDPGSALVFSIFIFTMYREGLHFAYLLLGFFAALLFIGTLSLGVTWVAIIVLLIAVAIYIKNR
ncbi:MAG: rod shape-determining protein RodA, partial [Bacteroidetes bacterium]